MKRAGKHRSKHAPDAENEPEPTSEEDLQARDPREMPTEPQNPVNPGPELPT